MKTDYWYKPEEYLAEFENIADAQVRKRIHKKHREAWVIAQLCLLLGASEFRVLRTEQFDGQYKKFDQLAVVEVTEIFEIGRTPGIEENSIKPSKSVPLISENIPCRIAESVAIKDGKYAKAKAHFSNVSVELVLYINLNVFSGIQNEIVRGLAQIQCTMFDVVHVVQPPFLLVSWHRGGRISAIKHTMNIGQF